MKIDINKVDQSKIEISFILELTDMEQYLSQALKYIGQNLKVNGFRPGKVPEEIVKRQVDEMKIWEEAATLAVKDIYPKTILEKNIDAIDRPEITITKLTPNNPLEFKAIVTIMPEIELPKDYYDIAKKIAGKNSEIKVEDSEIEEIITWLRNSQAKLNKVDRPSQMGDALEIDFETKCNNIPIEGGNGKSHSFVLGSNHFVPGFEEQLVGLKKGDIKEFQLEAPIDWPYENLRGKKLDFKAEIKEVNERVLPEINDELAKSSGKFEDLKQMKEKLRSEILENKTIKEKEKRRLEILDAISQKTDIFLTQGLIDFETDKMLDELNYSLEASGLKLDEYLNQIGKTQEQLRQDLKEQAQKRIKSALILKAVAKKENIQIPEEELTKRIAEEKRKYKKGDIDEKQFDTQNFREYIMGVMRNEKVFEFLESPKNK